MCQQQHVLSGIRLCPLWLGGMPCPAFLVSYQFSSLRWCRCLPCDSWFLCGWRWCLRCSGWHGAAAGRRTYLVNAIEKYSLFPAGRLLRECHCKVHLFLMHFTLPPLRCRIELPMGIREGLGMAIGRGLKGCWPPPHYCINYDNFDNFDNEQFEIISFQALLLAAPK